MRYNYIEESKIIVQELKDSGNFDLANKIEDILYNTFVQVELLMELSHLLKNVNNKVVLLSTHVKIKKLLDWIEQRLSPYPKE